MKYEKAKAEVISFDGIDIFMISSGDLSAIAQYINSKCTVVDTSNISNGKFTCSDFANQRQSTTYWYNTTMMFTAGGNGWSCGSFK